jgi:hypothetical protein
MARSAYFEQLIRIGSLWANSIASTIVKESHFARQTIVSISFASSTISSTNITSIRNIIGNIVIGRTRIKTDFLSV